MKRKVRIIFAVFSLLITFSVLLPLMSSVSYAETAAELKQKLNKKEAEHKKISLKAQNLDNEVKGLKKDLVSLSKNLQFREADLLQTEENLKELRKKKQAYIESIYQEHQSMGGVVSAARKYSRNPILSLFAQKDPVDAARSLSIIKSVIPTINQKANFSRTQLVELEEVEKNIEKQISSQRLQQIKLDVQKQKLATLVEKRKNMYEETQAQSDEYKKEVADLRIQSKNLEELVKNIETKTHKAPKVVTSSEDDNGMFMPVEGAVRTKFGEKDDMGAESQGLTFITLSGARVVTPLSGIVKFAGSFQNYKSLLIIEHPKGYHSLISGLDRIDTIVGANLAAGEPVGITSERLDSPRVYYELRKGGKPVNPQKILAAQGKS